MFESGATLIIVSYSASHKKTHLKTPKQRSLEKALFEPKRKSSEEGPLNSLIFNYKRIRIDPNGLDS